MASNDSSTVRRTFLDYFAKQGHKPVASASLVPHNDPTLLFTNAGMDQFKDDFTRKAQPPFPRATSAQKCVRAGGKHNDLENVGRTARHHTFFEMLGNFSFGDYFKADAIAFAWELLTKVLRDRWPKRLRLHRSHESDDEARALWKKSPASATTASSRSATRTTSGRWATPAPAARAARSTSTRRRHPLRRGERRRKCLAAACDGERWVEIWNLVFMQFEQVAKDDRRPLPTPSVDTGHGSRAPVRGAAGRALELRDRSAAAAGRHARQAVAARSSYRPITRATACRCASSPTTRAATAFLIADGVLPRQDRRANTCCAGSCAAPSVTAGCSASTQPFLHDRRARRGRARWATSIPRSSSAPA